MKQELSDIRQTGRTGVGFSKQYSICQFLAAYGMEMSVVWMDGLVESIIAVYLYFVKFFYKLGRLNSLTVWGLKTTFTHSSNYLITVKMNSQEPI